MNKILVIQTASLGDVILATSVAETLHARFPGCKIDMLIRKGYESLFAGHPFIHTLLLWDKKDKKYAGLLNLIWKVRKTRYDAVINIQRHFSSGLLTGLSGAAIRSGFAKNPLSFLFTHQASHLISATEPTEHEIVRNFRLIDFLISPSPARPALYPGAGEEAFVKSWKEKKYITIAPASLWFTKQYPFTKWIEFVNELPGDFFVYLLGAASDIQICEEIINQAKHTGIINLAGKLSTLQSAALMKGAIMNFVNDSAPLHLASATNSPITAVFCSTVPAFGFGPLSDNSAVVETAEKLTCKPCGLHGHEACPEKHFLCAESIKTSQLTVRIKYEQAF